MAAGENVTVSGSLFHSVESTENAGPVRVCIVAI